MNNNVLSLPKKALYSSMLIPIVYALLSGTVACHHHLFTDWDGVMHYFSAMDIYQGNGYNGWASHFWPPLYPVLIGGLSLFMNGFTAAKLISVAAASLLLFIVHRFTYHLCHNNFAACLAQLLVAVNCTFILLSIQAENHMLDSLFYVSAILLLLQQLEKGNNAGFILVGIIVGLAGLSRYTSYSLLPAFVITLFFFFPARLAFRYAWCIVLGFALVSMPWWIINYMNNGSPFATWQYMNIGAGVLTDSRNKWWWWWSGIDDYQSVLDIMLGAPEAYASNFFTNVLYSLVFIIYRGKAIGMLCATAVIIMLFRNGMVQLRTKLFLPLLLSLACFIILVSQAFVFGEVFLSWVVLVVIYGIFAAYTLSRSAFLPGYMRKPLLITAVVLVVCLDMFYTVKQTDGYINSVKGLEENEQIVAALRTYDKHIHSKVVMSFHPGRAYHTGSRYIMLPPYYIGDINGLVTYQHMSYKVRDHAPRFPADIDVNNLKTDYLIYDARAAICLPQFSFLLKKGDPRIPGNFRLVYLSQQAAVYRIE